MKLVWESAYVLMKVKSKKANVALPKEFINALSMPISGIKANEAIHSKLGQSIPTVIHKYNEPRKVPNTAIALCVIPEKGGKK